MAGKSKRKKTNKDQNQQTQNPRLEELSNLISLLASATAVSHSFLTQNDLLLHPNQTITLESSIISTAQSLSKLHSLISSSLFTPLTTLSSPCNPCWFQRFLASANDDSDPRWLENFHISKPTFTLLLKTLTPFLQNPNANSNFPPPEYKLATFLYRLAHAAPYKTVGRRFGLDSAGACRAFYQVCKAVNNHLSHLFEFSPNTEEIASESLPNCCGVLVFSYFLVDVGGKDGILMVQGLVDLKGKFLDVSAGWPGSMMPEKILRHSNLFSRVESGELLNGDSVELANGKLVRQYVLGDSCCPLLPWLLTPFSNKDENGLCELFNCMHNQAMATVGDAFGRVSGRWRLLSARWKWETLEFFPHVIVAGCLLHNFLMNCGEPMLLEMEELRDHRFPKFDGKEDEKGKGVRNAVAWHLSTVGQKE